MSNTGRAEAIIRIVQARVVYEESTDPFEVSTTYLVATAKLQNYHIGSRQSFAPTHQETPENKTYRLSFFCNPDFDLMII